MIAMVLEAYGSPLVEKEVAVPMPSAGEVLIRVGACGVCRTDLHIVDGQLPHASLPIIMGHEIAGTVVAVGNGASHFKVGDRVGVPWLGFTCGTCRFCRKGRENLCDNARFTGYTTNGGYAEYAVANQRYCFALPKEYNDVSAAPLLCAGLIGYRSFRMIPDDASDIGIYGFGAAAHIVAQIAIHLGKRIFAFTRPGDVATQVYAKQLGAFWVGSSDDTPPSELDAAILFASVGALVPAALRACAKGGTVVCGGIHMSDIPSFPYDILWGERVVKSVANLTRRDGEELLALAPKAGVQTQCTTFALRDATAALAALRNGGVEGAIVLTTGAESQSLRIPRSLLRG
jgi:propanol-preferring alcohol dehydrogenase